MSVIQQAKVELRQKILSTRKALSDVERARESQLLAEQLFALPVWQAAKCVGLYASAPDEVVTDSIIQSALDNGKIVALPKVTSNPVIPAQVGIQKTNNQQSTLIWHTIASLDDLEIGAFGIREPKIRTRDEGQGTKEVAGLASLDLLLVPGVAFDLAGGRLGYGGGFYDRTLQNFTCPTISLALRCQIVHEVPMEAHDVRVGQVIATSHS